MATSKGKKLYHNEETRDVAMFVEDPGSPWRLGSPPWRKRTPSPEQYLKASETKRKRRIETGPTQRELEGYRKLSETRKKGGFSPSEEVREKISKSLTGKPQKWQENKSRASCRRNLCDIVYVIKITTPEGLVFGKWGSSREKTFISRRKEFNRKKFSWEIVYWNWFGERTEDIEAHIGRKMSPYRNPEVPHFYGHTETFEWTVETQKLLEEVLNGLE